MDTANSILLNRVFTRNTFYHLINDEECPTYAAVVRRYIVNPEGKTHDRCISEIYQYLKCEHQNEYYYKNTLLNKLLLGVHSLRTTTALTEIPLANSKADFVLINGNAVVYEIKTALDNFDRLGGQIEDYYKVFSRVIVVTPECNYIEVQKKLQNPFVGICLLTKRGTLSIRREPREYNKMLSKSAMFRVLRKNEYERILLECFGSLPNVSQFEYYRACQKLFELLPIEVAYKSFVRMLKLRAKIDIEEYSKVPYELKFLVYFSNYKKNDYANLCRFLNT